MGENIVQKGEQNRKLSESVTNFKNQFVFSVGGKMPSEYKPPVQRKFGLIINKVPALKPEGIYDGGTSMYNIEKDVWTEGPTMVV